MRTRNRREGSYTSYGHAMVIYLLRNISRPRLPLLIASIQFILLYLRAFVFNVDNFGIRRYRVQFQSDDPWLGTIPSQNHISYSQHYTGNCLCISLTLLLHVCVLRDVLSPHIIVPHAWNNGKEVPIWGVAEIQKMSPSTTGRCK